MGRTKKKTQSEPETITKTTSKFFPESYGDEMFLGNTPEDPGPKKRITKRREKVISLLDEFDEESKKIELQIKSFDIILRNNEKILKQNIDGLKIFQSELSSCKERLKKINEISNNYIDIMCEKFDVKKEQIKKIRDGNYK